MESILSLIQKYKCGHAGADTQILERMSPLVKKYAAKIHCMEYEDALQELYMTLFESLSYLDPSQPEGKCLKYMKTSVENRYFALCKHYLSMPKAEDIDTCSATLEAPCAYDDSYYDIASYINSFPSESIKKKILALCFYEDKSDAEIAQALNVSRQYVNRIKKQLIINYFSLR